MTADTKRGAHTRGPWEYSPHPVRGLVQVVGEIDVNGNDESTCVIVCDVRDNPGEQANARLIAAAPDLLEALQELCNAIGPAPAKSKEALFAFGRAKAAIARATEGRAHYATDARTRPHPTC